MITYNKIDRKDLGELKIGIDWDNGRKVYLSMIDFIYMTMITEDDLIDECENQIVNPNTGEVYLDINEVIGALKQRNTLKDQRIISWLKDDVIPSINVIPKGASLKL